MCESLIFARTNTHPDPVKDRRGCYKRGMPVVLKEDKHHWGREESLRIWLDDSYPAREWPVHFYLFKFPGIPAERLRYMVEPQYMTDSGILLPGQIYRRREWYVDFGLLPQRFRNQLISWDEAVFSTAADRQAFLYALRRFGDSSLIRRAA